MKRLDDLLAPQDLSVLLAPACSWIAAMNCLTTLLLRRRSSSARDLLRLSFMFFLSVFPLTAMFLKRFQSFCQRFNMPFTSETVLPTKWTDLT